MRSLFGGMIVVGVVMQLVNLVQTLRVPVRDAAAIRRETLADIQELAIPAVLD